jgi:hypothetical protein
MFFGLKIGMPPKVVILYEWANENHWIVGYCISDNPMLVDDGNMDIHGYPISNDWDDGSAVKTIVSPIYCSKWMDEHPQIAAIFGCEQQSICDP